MPGFGGWCLHLASLFASGRWCNSVRSRDPGRIFPPKPGNGFSSSTEDHSRLLDRILVDLWPFKVWNIMITHYSRYRICLFYRLKVETNNGRATNHKNAVLLRKASTTNLYLLSELKRTINCILIKEGITISHFTNCAKLSSSVHLKRPQ